MTETLDKDQELELKKAIETLLFITDQPISIAKISQAVGVKDEGRVAAWVDTLRGEYEERGAAMQVLEVAEGFQMATRSKFAGYVRNLYKDKMTMRLSTAALETLAIISYKQPITRAEIEAIRGVEVIAALETLLEKALVKVVGRKDSIGRPLLYGTSAEFLRHFGLRSVEDLPPFEDFAIPEVDESESRGRDPGEDTLEADASPELEAKLAEDEGNADASSDAEASEESEEADPQTRGDS
ncbi:MAG: SMC-Scp complex subunit ScpB [Elusimicrobia bacterium CG_4_9_14_3_um_filter_62_55]|nr:MAG: SMC-Scp complex subunit ScpB [Elusimicrobia bacterium CG22_combo_CG10-13_8_21_14_all_63_91]PJA17445.1 MAG: SMC-Scp complex subunit ScpB [Elusimicrobia bacterium CG_4_10_14_0_2_um_filter_63_34]PJB25483.1 MAG: SMC-Scp complex subunit ScpB [Elusimicrobia bacterium CG_4_9_14_3_um_filter_62_55]